jgi:hypothetical protein
MPYDEDDFLDEEPEQPVLPVPAPEAEKPARERGRPRRNREKLDLPRAIDIPVTGDPALVVLPCAEIVQANTLGWYKDEVAAVNQTLGIYDKLPMLCQGVGCFWAELCPTRPGFIYKGMRCPLETIEVYRQFALLVRELEVSPEDHVDLNMIADLVRLDVLIKRCDMRIQTDGMMTEQVAGVAQKEGTPIYQLDMHQAIAMQDKLASRRDRIYKQLLASRDIKKKIELQQKGQENSTLDILTRLRLKAEELAQQKGGGHLAGIGGGTIIDATPGPPKALAPGNPLEQLEGDAPDDGEDLF